MKKTKYAGFFMAAALIVTIAAPFAYAGDAPCVFQVTPAAVSVDNDNVVDLKVIASGPACSFGARSNVDWVAVSPAEVRGSSIVRLNIAPSAERKIGTVNVAGQEITVFQTGLPHAYGRAQ